MFSMGVQGLLSLVASALPGVLGAGSGPSLLETPTYTFAGVLLFFLILSLVFERSTHFLIHYLKKRNRQGLAAAVSNLVTELTLIGLISLLLLVIQGPIHSICVPYTGVAYEQWILLGNVKGCDCCLADTSQVGFCFQKARDCGTDYCNCDGVNTCEPSDGLRRLLASGGGDTSGGDTDSVCKGGTLLEMELSTCGEGKAPLVSLNALHQIHLFIFAVAVSHVFCGIVMILLASWRVSIWRHWSEDEDEHAQEVRRELEGHKARLFMLKRSLTSTHRFRRLAEFVRRLPGHGGTGSANATPKSDVATPGGAVSARWFSPFATFRRHSGDGGSRGGTGLPDSRLASVEGSAVGRAARAFVQGLANGTLPETELTPTPTAEAGAEGASAGAGLPTIPSQASLPAMEDAAAASAASGLAAGAAGAAAAATGAAGAGAATGAGARAGKAAAADAWAGSSPTDGDAAEEKGQAVDREVDKDHIAVDFSDGDSRAPGTPISRPSLKSTNKRLLARSGTITTRRGWVWEWCICILQQCLPSPVTREEFRIMRASFMLTHKVPASFDFMSYITQSMEDDFSAVVGVSIVMWLTMLIFVLVSGIIGWPVLIFLILALCIQLLVDAKLVQIVRHVCRGGRVNHLASNIFWLQRPPLLLEPIRFTLFLTSFNIGTTIYFAAQFGGGSCPLMGHGFTTLVYMPWWSYLIISIYIFLDVSFKTLPMYSLAVQMGSDFKANMLPKGVQDKLLRIALRIKERRRQQLKEERAAALRECAGASGGGLSGHLVRAGNKVMNVVEVATAKLPGQPFSRERDKQSSNRERQEG